MLVGLTGGFGCGKTTVLRLFGKLGAAVLSADDIVHELLNRDDVRDAVAALFGPDVLSDGGIDRKKLSERVFSDEGARRSLERLLHPLVLETIRRRSREASARDLVMVVEVPLLFETGFDREVDAVVAVRAESGAVRRRLRKKGFSEEDLTKRGAAQIPVEEKASRADYVIDNSGPLEDTERQVRMVWDELLSRAGKG
ncbi:MAG TPA: dephospho-CoA kinase [Nitrospirae bacterium]|nr:dephospho-CoA kinase [Nitrospirota bacterium]